MSRAKDILVRLVDMVEREAFAIRWDQLEEQAALHLVIHATFAASEDYVPEKTLAQQAHTMALA